MYKEDKKTFRLPIGNLVIISLVILLLSSCREDEVNPDTVQNASSQLCNQVTGPKAIYWDLSNLQ